VTEFSTNPSTPARDRDSFAHTFGGTLFYDLKDKMQTDPRLRIDLAYTSNDADGSDFDYGSFSVSGGADLSLPWKVNLSVTYAVTNTNYDNPNSFSSGGTISRQDDQQFLHFNLSRSIAEGPRSSVSIGGSTTNPTSPSSITIRMSGASGSGRSFSRPGWRSCNVIGPSAATRQAAQRMYSL